MGVQVEVETVILSQAGPQQQRLLAFIDKNHDLCIVPPRDLSASTTAITLGVNTHTHIHTLQTISAEHYSKQ